MQTKEKKMKKQLPVKSEKYPYPSRYGSHNSMVFFRLGKTVFCRDEFGPYITSVDKLDNGLADPNRHNENRRK